MEPDPWSWLTFTFAIISIGLATAIEFVFVGTSRSEIRKWLERSDSHSQLIDKLLGDIGQLSITVTLLKSIGLVAAAVALVQGLPDAIQGVQLGVALLVVWLLFVGAQLAGRLFLTPHLQTATIQLAPVANLLITLFRPLTLLLGQPSGRGDGKDAKGEDDFSLFIQSNEDDTIIEEGEKQMIVSILELDDTVAREVMVPRIDIVALDMETSLREALDVVLDAGHSRIPVYREHVDQIVGILYAKDLLKCYRDNRADTPIHDLLRPAYFVPVSKKVNTLLKEMQKERVHIAMVVDEYGGTAGLVTIEDIIEEIVGDIQDEYDREEDLFVESIGTGVYVLSSRLDLYSLSKLLDVDLPDEDADTVGGLIYSLMGHVPDQGEAVECNGWRFTVLSLDGQRIDQVRAEAISPLDDNTITDTPPINARSSLRPAHDEDSLYNFQSSD